MIFFTPAVLGGVDMEHLVPCLCVLGACDGRSRLWQSGQKAL
jgi:hypothetical protein